MLSFAAPAFLGLAALVGVILILHSQRERRHVVGSLQIWRRLALPAGSRRTRRHVPPLTPELLLQIAAVLALALALARPFWGDQRAPAHLVVVLDASASMARPDGGGTRLAAAVAQLDGLLGARDRIGPQRISLLVAGVTPRLEAARWPWRKDVLAGPLQWARPTDGPADWQAAARLLPVLIRPDETSDVLFLSHTAAPEVLRDAAAGAELIEVAVGRPLPQVGVEAGVVAEDAAAGRWRVAGTVTFGGGLDATEIEIAYAADPGGTPLPWARLLLEADAAGGASFSQVVSLPGPGILTVAPSAPAGVWSNTARFVLADAPVTVEVLYLGPGGQPLLAALQAIPGVDIYQADVLPEDVSRFGLVVVDGVEVPRAPETHTLWIGAGRVVGAPEPAWLDEPDPDAWDVRHPLARDVDWTALRIGAARALPDLPLADTLLGSQGSPLVQARVGPQGREVRLAFSPADSNWPELNGFALFAAGLMDWFGLQPGMLPLPACEVGARCPMDARLAGAVLAPIDPADAELVTLVDPVEFRPEAAGLFQVAGVDPPRLVAVNAAPGPAEASEPPAASRPLASVLARSWSVWLLAVAAACLVAEGVISARRKGRFARPAPLALGAMALAVAAVLNLPLPVAQAREAVMLILPPPLGGGRQATDTRAAALAEARPGVISAGAIPAVRVDSDGETTPSLQAGPGLIPDGELAVALAAALVPGDRAGRIVLASDLGAAPGALTPLRRRDIVVERLPDAAPVQGEVLVRGIELPRQVIAGDAVPLIGLVHARTRTEAELRVLRDGEPVASQGIALAPGNNRIETTLPEIAPGDTLVEMEVIAPGDTFAENNRAGRIVTALPPRPIAILSPDEAHGIAFAGMLEREGLETVQVRPASAPEYQKGWLAYGGIVLLNMPAIALSTRQHGLIETAVAEHGLGLLVLGGPNSFGPGGYFETALERLSPLSSRIPRDAPEVAMVFVLDRSGSMQQPVGEGNRLDIAKRATLAAAELLNPASQVGIIVFDAEATTILPIGPLDLDRTRQALEGVDPGGGTSIYPGLEAALGMLAGAEAPARHIVVMTDGLSQPGDFRSILSRIRAAGITASAVAIGRGSDLNTVEAIAAMGGGSSHATTDFEALPSILSQEAMLLSAPIEEVRSQPRWVGPDAAFLRGLPNPMPPVEGFVLTTAKPEARVVLVTPDSDDEDMPLLAWWRYGNGTVLALATDATGGWTRGWHRLDAYVAMWGRALRQFQPVTPGPGMHLTADGDGEILHVALTALDDEGAPRRGLSLTASVALPESDEMRRVPMHEERGGRYRASVELGAPGRYEVTVTTPDGTEEAEVAFHHSYPVQYDLARPGGGAALLAAATGGGQRDATDIRTASAGFTWVWRGGWPAWALLALGLFIVELFRRYASLSPRPRSARTPNEPQGSAR